MTPARNGTLAEALGIEAGMTVSIFNSPNYFDLDLGDLPDDVEVNQDAEDAPADLFLIFADRSDEAQRGLERAVTNMDREGIIWFAWPENSSDWAGDISDNALRELFEPHGLIADREATIDDDWRGLRFVVADTAEWPPGSPTG